MNEFWDGDWPYGSAGAPPSEADLRGWEARFGVALPAALAAALGTQNGGRVSGTDLLIRPLGEILPLTGERWAHLREYETNRAFGDPARLILFGAYEIFPGSLVLDYNAGPEPRVVVLWHDMGDELRDGDDGSFDDLIRRSSNA